MAVSWTRPQATRERGNKSITISEMEELIAKARLSGAPDAAELKVDVALEIASPARVNRAVFDWEG